jgi:hypothetical protein
MRNIKTARMMVKRRGREGWMFFNPTIGTYQSRKMRKKSIKQVKTRSPMKILFLGLMSKKLLPLYCGMRPPAQRALRLGEIAECDTPSPTLPPRGLRLGRASGSERGGRGWGGLKFINEKLFPQEWGVRKEIPE